MLLIFVYLWVIPHCLSYQNAWMEPEQLRIKSCVLKTGPDLNLKDIKNGLYWQYFEYKPRSTRPLSSYFEILDTKFRCWLWRFLMPHPSLSLTWIFSLVLAPFFLCLLLKNLGTRQDIAMTMTAFYLATPGVLSLETMLFRPAKPMTNFFIIFCLYLASGLKKAFLDKDRPIPVTKFLVFWTITALSFYWDETALLILPAVLFVFPSIFKQRLFLFFWLLLPVMTFIAYMKILPFLTQLAGHGWPDLFKYDLLQSMSRPETIHHSLNNLGRNSWNLISQTMGIFPVSSPTPKIIILSMALCIVSWMMIVFYISKIKMAFEPLIAFLILLLFFFNTMMSASMIVWGPYYYGSFWSIFFVLFLSKPIEKAKIPKPVLMTCFFFIILSTANGFIGTNIVYKKFHWYPYSPDTIEDYFKGTKLLFDKRDAPVFNEKEIKSAIYQYWTDVKNGKTLESFSLPRELGWLPVELEPGKFYSRSIPGALFGSSFRAEFSDGGEILNWLAQKGYLAKYPPANYFIKEDLNTTIASGLKQKYPERWEKILAFLQETQSRKPYFYIYTIPSLAEIYNNRGNVEYGQGHFFNAIADYNKAIELKPDYEDAYYNLGFIYFKQGYFTQAITNYDQAIKINPNDTLAHDNRAVAYYDLLEALYHEK